MLIDEISVHEEDAEKIDDSMFDQEIEDEIDANEMMLNNSTENADLPCTTADGKSKC